MCLFVLRLFDLSLGGVEELGGSLLIFGLSKTAAEFELKLDGIVLTPLSVELSISMFKLSSLSSILFKISTSEFSTISEA